MTIKIVSEKITKSELQILAQETYVEMVKAVADVERGIFAVGGELHVDAEAVLLENGSEQKDLWGFNIYFRETPEDSLEFVSLINVRPQDGNSSLHLKKDGASEKITAIISRWVDWK